MNSDDSDSQKYNPLSEKEKENEDMENDAPQSEEDKRFSPHSSNMSSPPSNMSSPPSNMSSSSEPELNGVKIKDASTKTQFDSLPEGDKVKLMKMIAEDKANKAKMQTSKEEEPLVLKRIPEAKPKVEAEEITSILKVPSEEGKTEDTNESSEGKTKSVSFEPAAGETKKIII